MYQSAGMNAAAAAVVAARQHTVRNQKNQKILEKKSKNSHYLLKLSKSQLETKIVH